MECVSVYSFYTLTALTTSPREAEFRTNFNFGRLGAHARSGQFGCITLNAAKEKRKKATTTTTFTVSFLGYCKIKRPRDRRDVILYTTAYIHSERRRFDFVPPVIIYWKSFVGAPRRKWVNCVFRFPLFFSSPFLVAPSFPTRRSHPGRRRV